jgi:class 3 adenylate cyclase
MGQTLQGAGDASGQGPSPRQAVQARAESAAQQSVWRTLLVSDLEGFTPMLCALGDLAARDVIALHDQLLRRCLSEHHGVERAHTGDGVIASFAEAERAVACAALIQRRLRRYNLHAPHEATINVRIGVHAGRTLTHDNRLFGAAVNTAVRLCAAAAPGEVVISEPVRELVPASSWTLRDLGRVQLKGIPEPLGAFALDWSKLGSA